MKNNTFFVIFMMYVSFNGLTQNYIQLGADIPGNGVDNYFGYPAIPNADGSRVLFGAPLYSQGGDPVGLAQVYEFNGADWVQLGQDIVGDSPADQLGISMDINDAGTRFVANSRAEFSDGANSYSGDARVYELQGGNWVQLGTNILGPSNSIEFFGEHVSINANGTRVAASLRSFNGFFGLVRVYEFQSGNWVQIGDDIVGQSLELLGDALSLNDIGNRIAVGGPAYDGTEQNQGVIRIYELQGNNWVQIGDNIIGEAAGDEIGEFLEINGSGDRVISGEYDSDNGGNFAGQVRVFELQGNSWIQLGNSIIGENEEDWLGFSVSIDGEGNTIALTKVLDNINAGKVGAIGIYELTGNMWEEQTVEDLNFPAGEFFGGGVWLSRDGNYAATGAGGADGNDSRSGVGLVFVNSEILSTGDVNSNNNIALVPNPAQDILNIKTQELIKVIKIYSLQGSLVQEGSSASIDVSQLNAGLYFVQITFEGKTVTKKLIKE